jgi:hypothetical protein
MRFVFFRRMGVSAAFVFVALPVLAGKFSPADFPLRVHVVARNGIRHYYHAGAGINSLDQVDGLGQANLYENSQPRGFDFNYSCGQPITPQMGYDTFMARWKKQDRVLEILMPVMGGKPGEMNSCDLNVSLKQDTVYVRRNGEISEEPAAQFKEWMVKHQYDPEHGKDEPVSLKPEQPAAGGGENSTQ